MRRSIDGKKVEQWEEIPRTHPDWEFINWNHLAPGKYKLFVLNMRNSDLEPRETDFEIKPGDPEIVDLGKIKIPR